jgi:uncharacterized membrane protein
MEVTMSAVTTIRPRGRPVTARALAYWAATALVAAELGVGGVWDVARTPQVREIVGVLGYPGYFLVILGVWKILGAATLLAPRLPRVKEWAYAGAMFTYTGGIASHLAVRDGHTGEMAILAGMAVLAVLSWTLRPPARRVIITA